MTWLPFRRSSTSHPTDPWWRDADRAAETPTADLIAALRDRVASGGSPDETERRTEMIEGLVGLLALRDAPLGTVMTQHRVIGADICHLVIPATRLDAAGTPGKLLLTSARAIFVGLGVESRPWHRIRSVVREGRQIAFVVAGEDAPFALICNTYGDALAVRHVAGRLMA